jgi:hypothetical protein
MLSPSTCSICGTSCFCSGESLPSNRASMLLGKSVSDPSSSRSSPVVAAVGAINGSFSGVSDLGVLDGSLNCANPRILSRLQVPRGSPGATKGFDRGGHQFGILLRRSGVACFYDEEPHADLFPARTKHLTETHLYVAATATVPAPALSNPFPQNCGMRRKDPCGVLCRTATLESGSPRRLEERKPLTLNQTLPTSPQ